MLARIAKLAVPPAWTQVWICPDENGHLQASGRDARGRKQYRYHNEWSTERNERKHQRISRAANRLEALRAHCERQLRRREHDREKVLTTLLWIVDETGIRVGHDEYTRANHSFGLTTLCKRHVRVNGSRVDFHFKGKSGVDRKLSFRDARVARVISRCMALPGTRLFRYADAEGLVHPIYATQLNAHLREVLGDDLTIKDLRTWSATVRVAVDLARAGAAATERATRISVLTAVRSAAQHLGNTAAVCRKSYVHPSIITAYLHGELLPLPRTHAASTTICYRDHEAAVCAFLQRDRSKPAMRKAS